MPFLSLRHLPTPGHGEWPARLPASRGSAQAVLPSSGSGARRVAGTGHIREGAGVFSDLDTFLLFFPINTDGVARRCPTAPRREGLRKPRSATCHLGGRAAARRRPCWGRGGSSKRRRPCGFKSGMMGSESSSGTFPPHSPSPFLLPERDPCGGWARPAAPADRDGGVCIFPGFLARRRVLRLATWFEQQLLLQNEAADPSVCSFCFLRPGMCTQSTVAEAKPLRTRGKSHVEQKQGPPSRAPGLSAEHKPTPPASGGKKETGSVYHIVATVPGVAFVQWL